MNENPAQETSREWLPLFCIFVLSLAILASAIVIYHKTDPVTVHFIDIGQGDSCLIKAGDGGTVLIDGGDMDSGQILETFFFANNVNHLDAVFISHFHQDHVLGIIELLNANFPISHLYFSEHPSKTEYEETVIQLAKKHKIPITRLRTSDSLTLGQATYRVLYQEAYQSESDFNNMSMILRLDYHQSSILFTGDIEKDGAKRFLDTNHHDLKVDVFKVPHHGGASSASLELFQAASPEYCVISLDMNNQYETPAPVTLSHLLSLNSLIYRTDLNGTISMTLGKKGIKNISYHQKWR